MINFILGCVFILVVVPLLENFGSIIEALSQLILQKIAEKMAIIQNRMASLETDEDEETSKNPMGFVNSDLVGFQVAPEPDYEDEDE